MNRTRLYLFLLAIWLVIAFFAFRSHARTAAVFLPFFTVAAVLYAAWVTYRVIPPSENKTNNENQDPVNKKP